MTSDSSAGWAGLGPKEFLDLAEEYRTPFFLYHADTVIDRIKAVRTSFDNFVRVFYAVKANPNLALLRSLVGIADGLDISSGGELEQAALAGFAMEKLSFAGPAKTIDELQAAIKSGIGSISIESLRELTDTIQISKSLGVKANIVLRVNPEKIVRSFGLKMCGKMQFGIDEENIGEALTSVLANPEAINFKGVHVYAGSQCFEPTGIIESVENTFRIVREIESQSQLECKTINFGGGFGVSHTENNLSLDLAVLAAELLPSIRASYRPKREMIFELGRFLTADAGIYVVRVISSKVSRGKAFYMVDGGLNHHLAASGTFGAAFRSNFVLRNLSRPTAEKIKCSIAGPSCNPTDLLGIDVELSKPEHGDLIAVMKSGSYAYTASPLLFLGRRTPAELVLQGSKVILGRRSRSITDFN